MAPQPQAGKPMRRHILAQFWKNGEWWYEIESHHENGKVTYLMIRMENYDG